MVYFCVRISHNEILNLQQKLDEDNFCLVCFEASSDEHYGVVREGYYNDLLHILSAETLEELEYLTANEFRQQFAQRQPSLFFGNRRLWEENIH
jgi:hypothetical protein